MKLAKVPTWTTDMTLEMVLRQLDISKSSNTDVLESTQFKDLVKSLKLKKKIKGLAKYVSEQILTTINKMEKHKKNEVIQCLET